MEYALPGHSIAWLDRPGFAVVIANIDALCSHWNEYRKMGIENCNSDRLESFRRLIKYNIPIEIPMITISQNGNAQIDFMNGRHRTSFLKYYGEKELPILVPEIQAPLFISSGIARSPSAEELESLRKNTLDLGLEDKFRKMCLEYPTSQRTERFDK